MPFLSLTTWSLHRNLGPLHWTEWDELNKVHRTKVEEQPSIISLLDLPAMLKDKGYAALEICHFHFPETHGEYIEKLKQSVAESGLRFYTLLIDYGDISSADEVRRRADIDWIKQWIDIAALADAERVRVTAGQADPSDQAALSRSLEAFKELCDYGVAKGVRVITENFLPLSSTADNCLFLINGCEGRLGLTADLGNLEGDTKYDELEKIIPRSESIHAKALTDENGLPNAQEFKQCMEIVKRSQYEGPITLVYDGPHDMWEGIERVKKLALPYL